MSELLNTDNRTVRAKNFGQDWDSHCVDFFVGGYSESNFPNDLNDILQRRKAKGNFTLVPLGPEKKFFCL